MSEWYANTQGATVAFAENANERWSVEDLDFVVAFTDDARDEDLAIAVGRSLASIWSIQHRIRTVGVEGVRDEVEREARRRVASREVGYDYVTTFPPGHFD